jgi:ribosomal protein S11
MNTFFFLSIFFSRILIYKALFVRLKSFLIFIHKIKLFIFYEKKHFHCFIKKKLNNLFLTVTNRKGDVLLSLSAGNVKISSKKKKNSPITLNQILKKTSLFLVSRRVFFIESLFISLPNKFLLRNIFSILNQFGIKIGKVNYITPRPHSSLYRKKKIRRI